MTALMPERCRDTHQWELEQLRSGGEPRILGKVMELHGLAADGGEFPLEFSLATRKVGTEAFFTGIVRDITDRSRAQVALQNAPESLRALIRTSPLALFAFDPEGRVTLWSPAAE